MKRRSAEAKQDELGPLDDSPKRARAQKDMEAETEELRENEDGKFWLDDKNCIGFELKHLDLSGEAVGRGTFSEKVVKAVFKPKKMQIAVKIMSILNRPNKKNNEGKGIEERSNEVTILKRAATDENVVALYGFLTWEMRFYMCMELMDANLDELRTLIHGSDKAMALPKAKIESFLGCVTVSVVDALYFLRNKAHVIHRDLKPHNIMVSREGYVKLCDFGVSKKLQTAVSKTRAITKGAGTFMYMSPERFDGEKGVETHGVAAGYGSKAEVWALGVTLYEFATDVNPYAAATELTASELIKKSEIPKLEDDEYSQRLRNFIECCLFKAERQRSSVDPADKDNNHLQSKRFYLYHAARNKQSTESILADVYVNGKAEKKKGVILQEIPRRACVTEVLDHVKAGLPELRKASLKDF